MQHERRAPASAEARADPPRVAHSARVADRGEVAAKAVGMPAAETGVADTSAAHAGTVEVGRLSAPALLGLQRMAGNRVASALVAQRQAAPATTGTSYILDGERVATYADLARWYETRAGRLQREAAVRAAEGVVIPLPVVALPASSHREVARLRARGAGELDDDALNRAAEWLTPYEDAFDALDRAYGRAVAANLEQSARGLTAAGGGLEDVTARLRDQQRRAMLAGDENAVLAVTDLLQSALDTALAFKEQLLALRGVSTELLAEELKWLGRGTPPSARWLPRVLEIATAIDKAYAVFSLARAAYTLAVGGATEAQEAREAVGAMSTVISAGATLMNASAVLTVYVNVYLGPMTTLGLRLIAKIEQDAQEWNLQRMQEGNWDLVNWWVEPTQSRAMFLFLRQVMRASESGAVPTPPDAVADRLLKGEKLLRAGTGEALPTTGIWFWKRLDDRTVKRWLFTHRRTVWAMYFGSAPPPA